MSAIPVRYAPFLFAIIQAGVTTGFATAIATYHVMPLGAAFATRWLHSWMVAWVMIVPIVVLAAPFIQWLVARMTAAPRSQPQMPSPKPADAVDEEPRTAAG